MLAPKTAKRGGLGAPKAAKKAAAAGGGRGVRFGGPIEDADAEHDEQVRVCVSGGGRGRERACRGGQAVARATGCSASGCFLGPGNEVPSVWPQRWRAVRAVRLCFACSSLVGGLLFG